jgi:hypothetical protein
LDLARSSRHAPKVPTAAAWQVAGAVDSRLRVLRFRVLRFRVLRFRVLR